MLTMAFTILLNQISVRGMVNIGEIIDSRPLNYKKIMHMTLHNIPQVCIRFHFIWMVPLTHSVDFK